MKKGNDMRVSRLYEGEIELGDEVQRLKLVGASDTLVFFLFDVASSSDDDS